LQFKDVTSTSFGLVIAFLLPGIVALFSLTFWFESAADAFHTFLTAASNVGLFIFLLLGALTLGVVASAVRWIVYEKLLALTPRIYDQKLTPAESGRIFERDRFAAFRASIDETYRYHQFFGGMTITAPALFIGWLSSLDYDRVIGSALILGFLGVESILVVAAISARRSWLRYAKAILGDPKAATAEGLNA
jgi:hypothetical protein